MKKLDRHQIQKEFNIRKVNMRMHLFQNTPILDFIQEISLAIQDLQKENFDVSASLHLLQPKNPPPRYLATGTIRAGSIEESLSITHDPPDRKLQLNIGEASITLRTDKHGINPDAIADMQKVILNICARDALLQECDAAGVFKKPEDDIRPVVSLNHLKKRGMEQ
jgi:cytochrome c-type biogenesis protein CcmE